MIADSKSTASSVSQRRRGQGLSAHEQIVRLATSGDLQGLVDAYVSDTGVFVEEREKAELVQRALDAHKRGGGVAAVVDAIFGQMLAFDSTFLVCCQTRIQQQMRDHAGQAGFQAGPPPAVLEHELTRLAQIEDRLIQLARAFASIQHVLALAKLQSAGVPRKGRSGATILRLATVGAGEEPRRRTASG